MVFLALINSFIHTIMYTYYFLAACGPNIQKAIAPMKPWITISQMIQFVVLLLYVSQQHILGCKVVNNWTIIT
ncbi:PREDICTED: elongation of very long chain fatty acids protein AAEL008004-like, partial [Wasmannia auropunctata]|uniref:elongation of very long chain fatty acids protein AAEL008004-like n=1 Tax=Wasmannia auropunctata TaxID=64793 RepID=UPI0005ED9105